MRSKSKGSALLFLLILATLLFSMSVILAGLGTSHLRFAQRTESEQRAINAAESALAVAIEKLKADHEFGTPFHPHYDRVLEVHLQQSVGRVLFSPELARQYALPYSLNNLEQASAELGWNQTLVPGRSVYLLASGEDAGVRRTVVAVVHRPPYPFVIASSGPVVAPQGLLVGSVGDQVPHQASDLDREKLLPGELASNSNESQAVVLGPGSLITGSVTTNGGVILDATAQVMGAVKPEVAEIPTVELRDYNPRHMDGAYQELPPYLSDEVLTGRSLSKGDLEFHSDLELDQALLFVEGDLTVYGGIRGQGIVVVQGDVEVRRGCQLSASNQAALLAKGDICLRGLGSSRSAFQGLVYTEGDFRAEEISLLGTFVANSTDDGGSSVSLREASAIHAPKLAVVEVTAEPEEFDLEARVAEFLSSLGSPSSHDGMGETHWTIPLEGPGVAIMADPYSRSLKGIEGIDFIVDLRDNGDGTGDLVLMDYDSELSPSGQPADPAIAFELIAKDPQWTEAWGTQLSRLLDSAGFPASRKPSSPRDENAQPEVRVDLDTFLKSRDRLRVVLWKAL